MRAAGDSLRRGMGVVAIVSFMGSLNFYAIFSRFF